MLPVEADDAYWVLVALNIVVLRVHDMCSSPWFMIYLFFWKEMKEGNKLLLLF